MSTAASVADPALFRRNGGQPVLTSCQAAERVAPSAVVVATEGLVRDGLVRAIEHRVRVVASAGALVEADEMLRLWRPRLCLVVLEPPLPGGDIEETVELLAGGHPRTAVVALFRTADGRSLAAARRHGVRGFLSMAATADELHRALEAVDHGEVALAPPLAAALLDATREDARHAVAASLTEAQVRTLELLATGFSSKEIARRLGTTTAAVNHLIERASRRLEATHRTHAVAQALRLGLIR